MENDDLESKINLNLTEKLREKITDLMSISGDNETDVIFEAIEKLHENRYLPYKKMMDLEEKRSQQENQKEENDNPFNFSRLQASDEAYLATLEDELKEYKDRGDTEMIFLTREKIDKVKDKIRNGKAY